MAASEIRKGPAAPNRFDPDPERSYTLPAHYYVEPEIFEREKEAIFFRSWQFAGHANELKEPGSYITTRIFDQNIGVIRGKDGAIRAFYNVCSHRGHELLKGRGKEKLIACPYHGWTYNLDGSLFSARGTETMKNFERKEFCLKEVRVESFLNLVFVNLDARAPSLASQAGDMEKEIREFVPELDELKFACRCTFDIKGNWKNVTDNFLECYHCPIAHPAFVQMVDMDTYRTKTHGIWSSHLSRCKPPSKKTPYRYKENPEAAVACFWHLWPNLTLNIFPGRANFGIFHFVPSGPERTLETFDFYLRNATPDAEEQATIDYFEKTLNPEDFGLVESVQRGLHSRGFHQSRYVIDEGRTEVSEHALHHFHSLVLDALGDLPGQRRAAE